MIVCALAVVPAWTRESVLTSMLIWAQALVLANAWALVLESTLPYELASVHV